MVSPETFHATKAMKNLSKRKAALALVSALFFCSAVRAQNLDAIGVTLLRTVTTNVDGAGIRVAQPEADESVNPIAFEVNPAHAGQPASLFAFFSAAGSTN